MIWHNYDPTGLAPVVKKVEIQAYFWKNVCHKPGYKPGGRPEKVQNHFPMRSGSLTFEHFVKWASAFTIFRKKMIQKAYMFVGTS